jgi:ATP-binding cassette subfamily B protein
MPGLRRIFRYMQPYRWIAIVGFFTVILPVIMELVTPRMVQFVIDKGIRGQNMAAVWQGSLVMLAAALIGAITTLGQGVCRAQISQGIAFDLRNALFRHIQSLSFADLDRLQTGQLMTRISSDVDVVRMFLSAGLALLLRALLMILGSLTMMLLIDVRLSMIMVSMLAITGLIIWYILRVTGPMFTAVQEKLAALNTMVQENLAGVRVVKAYVREPYAIERFAEVNEAYMEQNVRVGRYLAVVLPVLLVLTNVGAALAIWRGGLDVNSGRISIGELLAQGGFYHDLYMGQYRRMEMSGDKKTKGNE